MTLADFPSQIAAEIARLETEVGRRCIEIDRLNVERDGLSRLLSHLYPLRAAYEDAAPAALAGPLEPLVERAVEDALSEPALVEYAAAVREAIGQEPEDYPAAVAELVETVADGAPGIASGSLPAEAATSQNGDPALMTLGPERDREQRAPSAACSNAGAEGAAPDGPTPAARPVPALGMVWTAADDARLMALRKEGLTHRAIAARLGRSVKAVDVRSAKLRKTEAGDAPRPTGPVVDTDRLAEMRRLRAEGQTFPAIGERLGMTAMAVRMRLMRAAKDDKAAGHAESPPEPAAAEPEEPRPEPIEASVPAPVTAPATTEPPALVASDAASLPALRPARTAPAPRPVTMVTEAIREVSRSDRPLLGNTLIDKAPPLRSGTSDLRRKIVAHLDLIGHDGGWTPRRDLDLFEGICAANLADTAKRLDVSQEAAAARFKGLCQPIRDPRTGNSVEGQTVLHAVLIERAALQMEAAE